MGGVLHTDPLNLVGVTQSGQWTRPPAALIEVLNKKKRPFHNQINISTTKDKMTPRIAN